MGANAPESTIPPTTAERSWWFALALNLPKDMFFARIHPLNPGDKMLPQKLLVDIGVDMFTGENSHRWPKSTRSALIPVALLLFSPSM
jgi:hypothetical protein